MDEVVVAADQIAVSLPREHGRFYRHGWQSWSETRWLDPLRPPAQNPVEERWPMVDDPAFASSDVHGGSSVGAVELGEGKVQLVGALGLGGRVELRDGELRGSYENGRGEWLVATGPEDEVFARYRDLLGERLGIRPPRGSRIWCSWYSFYASIDEQRLVDVLDDLRGLPFDVFQIDDGWQQAIGDWQPNDRFRSGLAPLASRSREHGFEPGLWIAPFLARESSDLFRANRSMFASNDAGEPLFAGRNWGGECYALDVTHPAAQEYLTETISTAVAEGFTYLKLDFLYAAALPGRRHADVPREQAYREACELMRRAAGPDVYLLACGAPIIPSLGVFDGIRVGPDVAPWWEMPLVIEYLHDVTAPATRYAIATSLHRLWLRPLIETDPDVVYFRRKYNLLDRRARTMLQDLALVAGFRATSDPPAWLDERERAELVDFFASTPKVTCVGRHRYEVDGRLIDFSSIADTEPELRRWAR